MRLQNFTAKVTCCIPDEYIRIHVSGDCDLMEIDRFRKIASKVIGYQTIVIDAKGLTFVDSTFLGTLVALRKAHMSLRGAASLIRVVNVVGSPLNTFQITGLERILSINKTEGLPEDFSQNLPYAEVEWVAVTTTEGVREVSKFEKTSKLPAQVATPKSQKPPMTVREAGRKGGETTSQRHGPAFYEEIGRKGGHRVRELIERGKRASESPDTTPNV